MDRLQQLANDFLLFVESINIPTSNGVARFGDVMAPFQRARFRDLAPDLHALREGKQPPCGRFWLEGSKGCSKDGDISILLLYLIAFTRRSETLRCEIGAVDADQADEVRKSAKNVLKANPFLETYVEIQSNRIVSKSNPNVEATILTADVAGSHGSRPNLVVINEASHITKSEFAFNLFDNARKMANCTVIIATNAGQLGTWQHEWRELARESERWKFHCLAEPAPWIDPAAVDEARRMTPASRFRRLWYSEWSTGEGDGFDWDDIDAAVTLPGPLAGPERGWAYLAGLDVGVRRDTTALATVGVHVGYTERIPKPERPKSRHQRILEEAGLLSNEGSACPDEPEEIKIHPGSGKIKLARLSLWQPGQQQRVDFSSIERECLAAHRLFRLRCLAADPSQAEDLIQRLRRQGVNSLSFDQTGPNLHRMATAVHDALIDRNLELFNHEELIADLRIVRLIERSYGLKLEPPRSSSGDGTQHGDAVIAMAIALAVAKKITLLGGDFAEQANRELICWP